MTTEQRKEETRDIIEKIIVDWLKSDNENATYCAHLINEKFYSEIEARDKKHEEEWMLQLRAKEDAIKLYQKIHDKLQRLEEIIKAADKSINKFGELITAVHVAVEKSGAKILLTDSEIVEKLVNESSDLLTEYRLKSKLPSGI